MGYEKSNKLHIVTPVAVIMRSDGRILLLKRRDDEVVYPGFYTFPGGKVEGNDTISQTLIKEVKEECGLDLKTGFILIKEKAIFRPDGQTSKSLSFLCEVTDPEKVVLDTKDFTDFRWTNLEELKTIKHVGIEAEFIKARAIYDSKIDRNLFFTDTDQVDFSKK